MTGKSETTERGHVYHGADLNRMTLPHHLAGMTLTEICNAARWAQAEIDRLRAGNAGQATEEQLAACRSVGTSQCAAICLSNFAPYGERGCPEAHRVWTPEAIERERKRRPVSPETPGEPRIFVEVLRPVGKGHYAKARKEINLMEWDRTRHTGAIVKAAINDALAELGYKP